jgi:hypothetical protein
LVKAWKPILAALVIFCAGWVTGALMIHVLRPNPSRSGPGSIIPIQGPFWARMEFLRRAEKQLDLTPAQREHIDRIIAEGQDQLRQLWEPVAPQAQAELRQIQERILAELNPKQRACFDELSKQRGPRRGEPQGDSRDHPRWQEPKEHRDAPPSDSDKKPASRGAALDRPGR